MNEFIPHKESFVNRSETPNPEPIPDKESHDAEASLPPLTEQVTHNETTQPTAVSDLQTSDTAISEDTAEKHSGETWDDFLFF